MNDKVKQQSLKRSMCPEGMGYCGRCDAYMDASMFRKNKNAKNGLYHYCNECARANDKKYEEQNVHRHRRKNYGITSEQYSALHAEQGGVCAICGKPEKKLHKGKKVDLGVDHDHVTGKIRGLLCDRCNAGLGHFGDNIEIMQRAVEYLRRTQETQDV